MGPQDSTVESRLNLRRGPGGVHLFDRASGLNVLLDEIAVPRSEWSAAPRFVSIALTNACDLSCSHCYAPKTGGRLSHAEVTAWLHELGANGCLGVGFGGGEPTLHPDFATLCKFAMTETALAVTFTTHGHHLDDDLLNELSGNVNFVRVSMDGVGRTYKSIRGRSFTQLTERIERLRGIVAFGINFVVNSHTIGDLDAAVAQADALGAAEFLILPERPTANAPGIGSGSLALLSDWVARYRGRVPLTIGESSAHDMPFHERIPGEEGVRAYLHIDANGMAKASSFDQVGVQVRGIGPIRAVAALQGLELKGIS